MEQDELAAIRAARLNQLKQEGGSNSSEGLEAGEGEGSALSQEDEIRRDILATVLDTNARERLSRISLVNPNLSTQIGAILVRMAQSGQLRGKVTEEQLIGLLDQAEGVQNKSTGAKKGSIVFQRRKAAFDDDDDFDL